MNEEYLHDALYEAQEDKRDALDRIAKLQADHAAEVARLTEERDALASSLEDRERRLKSSQTMFRDMRENLGINWKMTCVEAIDAAREVKAERDAAVRERDAAVEALKLMLRRHGCVEGCCASARAVLAKIGGQG